MENNYLTIQQRQLCNIDLKLWDQYAILWYMSLSVMDYCMGYCLGFFGSSCNIFSVYLRIWGGYCLRCNHHSGFRDNQIFQMCQNCQILMWFLGFITGEGHVRWPIVARLYVLQYISDIQKGKQWKFTSSPVRSAISGRITHCEKTIWHIGECQVQQSKFFPYYFFMIFNIVLKSIIKLSNHQPGPLFNLLPALT